MDLSEAMRTTGAVRAFTDDPVPGPLLAEVLDDARFAPGGGNRQAWHVVVVEDPEQRRRMRDLYATGRREALALAAAGLTPFAPTNDRGREAEVLGGRSEDELPPAGEFADRLHEVPVMLVVLADLSTLAAIDRDLGRYTIGGGASVYPFAQNVLLAARARGLGGVITTFHQRREPDVLAALAAPEGYAVATTIVLGWPVRQVRRLRRREVPDFTTVDRFDGAPFAPVGEGR